MQATVVIALVIEAIQNTVSSVIGAGSPRRRTPNAPSYSVSRPLVAMATTPGI
jgi:hypothetical protein